MKIVNLQTWKNISITKKLYFVVGLMAILIAGELLLLGFAMNTLSAVRAFVGGEGLWSKAQKNAIFSLQRYGITLREKDFEDFLEHLKIPEGDSKARLALSSPNPDLEAAREGFLQGRIHPEDIDPMIELLLRFSWISYLKNAIDIWSEADQSLSEFKQAGLDYHEALNEKNYDVEKIKNLLTRIRTLNNTLTDLEDRFSYELGEGSRWLEHFILSLLFILVLTVEAIGLSLTFSTSRSISRGLNDLNEAAQEIGKGNFNRKVDVTSSDELGRLAESVNRMGGMLEKSYRNLESRVEERTIELRILANENARLYEKANSALKAREEFMSIASHELMTPMTTLTLQLQQLDRAIQNPIDKNRLSEMSASALRQLKRLTGLVDELLDLTLLRIGKLKVQRVKGDLVSIVKEVILQLSPEAEKKGITISLSGDVSVLGEYDPTRVAQVTTNLITNAIKYGDRKPIRVIVKKEANEAILSVEDGGVGIPSELQSQIFERFERGGRSNGSVSGLGLGLYICKQILDAHNGSIGVVSELGKGSQFTVRIRT